MSLSTHVLDTARGGPAAGVPVRLESLGGERLAEGVTDHDGRLRDWVPAERWRAGSYRLVFETAGAFFPEVAVVFRITDPSQHYHVPLLLSPFGYTVYKGS
ncbi:MAG: hydroxyisourate hydrolase [Micromonosporaceae bacterium]|nr:hydroxyisourate hydrolase [Micromonosporaceae bacterium]